MQIMCLEDEGWSKVTYKKKFMSAAITVESDIILTAIPIGPH
jgi:hypothetical protein